MSQEPPDPAASRRHPGRWGLLITVLVMGIALVGSGLLARSTAHDAAEVLRRQTALNAYRTVQRGMRFYRHEPSVLAELAADHAPDGLRYASVRHPDGDLLAEAGDPEVGRRLAAALSSRGAERLPHGVVVARDGGWTLIEGPLRPGPRGPGRRRLRLVVAPEAADQLEDDALRQLIASTAAALVLFMMGALFWRAAARADQAARALARERHLASLGEMSAVLGHELKNPLASLKGHAQLVVERLPAEHRAAPSAARVVHEAVRMERLTSHILAFARTGRIVPREGSPEVAIAAAVDALRARSSAGAPGITVRAEGAPERWRFDPDRVHQVLLNLLDNAVQASPPGAAIDLRCSERGGRLLFSVRDRGAGIRPGDEEAIFEPFRTGRVQGTGLGLAIARRIAEAHGGHLTGANHPDGGAVFTLTLPSVSEGELWPGS